MRCVTLFGAGRRFFRDFCDNMRDWFFYRIGGYLDRACFVTEQLVASCTLVMRYVTLFGAGRRFCRDWCERMLGRVYGNFDGRGGYLGRASGVTEQLAASCTLVMRCVTLFGAGRRFCRDFCDNMSDWFFYRLGGYLGRACFVTEQLAAYCTLVMRCVTLFGAGRRFCRDWCERMRVRVGVAYSIGFRALVCLT